MQVEPLQSTQYVPNFYRYLGSLLEIWLTSRQVQTLRSVQDMATATWVISDSESKDQVSLSYRT